MKKPSLLIFALFITVVLISGCTREEVKIIKVGTPGIYFGNEIKVLSAQRFEQRYKCGDYYCYNEMVFILLNWRCTLDRDCILAGSDFSLLERGWREQRPIVFTSDVERLFSIPVGATGCCGMSSAGSSYQVYLIFRVGCANDYLLQIKSEGYGKLYNLFEIPSAANCRRIQ